MKQNSFLTQIWARPMLGVLLALSISAFSGFIAGQWTPRGPLTTSEVLLTMVLALVMGFLVGMLMGNRWAYMVFPIAFWAMFEITRLSVVGPSVDAIHLGSTYGVIAFVLGRFLNVLVVLLPALVGTKIGLWLTMKMNSSATIQFSTAGWVFPGIAAVMLIIAAVNFAKSPHPTPILGEDGMELPGSISELGFVEIGGHPQALMIRGRDETAPLILYLAGGPGGTDLGAMRNDVSMEQDFVVVTWDQRGAGKSYPSLDPIETLTLDQMIADTVELTRYLRDRFDKDKIYLVGNSWGTLLGVLTVQQQPDLFYAYIGTGQMVSPKVTDQIFYEDTLIWARENGNSALVQELEKNGPPPYTDILLYEPAISHEHDWNPYPYLDMSLEMPSNLFVPENSLVDRLNGLRGFLDTFTILYPKIQDLDLRSDASTLQVPVYIVMGKYEARGRAELATQWFDLLQAPYKELIIFERSGHRPLFEEPGNFASLMERVFLETTAHAVE